MTRSSTLRVAALAVAALAFGHHRESQAAYTRLAPVEVKILAAAKAFPGAYEAENVLREGDREYASHSQGVKTFIDFDFGRSVPVAAFSDSKAA